MKTTIPIVFTFDRNYLLAAKVTFHSLLRYASKEYRYAFYVLHTQLEGKDEKSLLRVVSKFSNATLELINVSNYEHYLDNLDAKKHFSKEIFYKLILPDIFPQHERILLSDVDVIYLGDVAPAYFHHPNQPFYYAGIEHLYLRDISYYNEKFSKEEIRLIRNEANAGFLLFNLAQMRRDHKVEELISFYTENYSRLFWPEQNCLAIVCGSQLLPLPLRYMIMHTQKSELSSQLPLNPEHSAFRGDRLLAADYLTDEMKHIVQLHYIGRNKPWNSFCIPQQGKWMRELYHAGLVWEYLKNLPHAIYNKNKTLSLRRFLKKVGNKLFSQKQLFL